jgi:hypothetical protein
VKHQKQRLCCLPKVQIKVKIEVSLA